MKTQTRRVVKPQPVGRDLSNGARPEALSKCPYGVQDDRLWVREMWATYPDPHAPLGDRPLVAYRATDKHQTLNVRWRPSSSMPRWASRITLEVTGVRVERLQGITEADAIAEGVEQLRDCQCGEPFSVCDRHGRTWRDYTEESPPFVYSDPRFSFRSLWESINGGESWAANPWVWVVEFKRLDIPGPLPDGVRERPIIFSAPMVRAILRGV